MSLHRHDKSLQAQTLCTLLVALSAAYVSYRHGREFALRFGADSTTATLWPLIVDGLLTITTIELWKTSAHQRATGQWKAWLSFALGIGLSLCANTASAPGLTPPAIAVATCPPLALLLSVELLNHALKQHRAQTRRSKLKFDETESTQPDSANASEASPPQVTSKKITDAPAQSTVINNTAVHSAQQRHITSEAPHTKNHDQLRETAYRLDAEHWNLYHRPISADTLRRKLNIGSTRARTLTHHIRQNRKPRTTRH
jgi:hypothetical protein